MAKFIIGFIITLISLSTGAYLLWPKRVVQKEEILGSSNLPEPTKSPSPSPSQSPSISPTVVVKKYIYKGDYKNFENTSSVSLFITEGKTKMTGTVSGACNGALSGKVENGKLEGFGSGNCSIWGVEKYATVVFNADMINFPKKFVLHFDGKSGDDVLRDSMELLRE